MCRDKNGRFIKGYHASIKTEFKKGYHVNIETEFKEKDIIQYRQLHRWVRKYLPEPQKCEDCGENKKLDLANITGLYNRDLINWKYLCRKCHMISDGRSKKWFGQ